MTGQPTNQPTNGPTNRRLWEFIGKGILLIIPLTLKAKNEPRIATMRITKKTMTMTTPTLTGSLPAVAARKLGGQDGLTVPAIAGSTNNRLALLSAAKDWMLPLTVKLIRQPRNPATLL